MKHAICAGSFNPVTLGHLDIFERAAAIFDEVVVLLVYNSAKHYDVSVEARLDLLKKATAHIKNVTVECHVGLLINYVPKHKTAVLVKGVRSEADLTSEMAMAFANSAASGGLVDTVLIPTRPEFTYVSSTIVREFASYGGDISKFVPNSVKDDISKIYYKGDCQK